MRQFADWVRGMTSAGVTAEDLADLAASSGAGPWPAHPATRSIQNHFRIPRFDPHKPAQPSVNELVRLQSEGIAAADISFQDEKPGSALMVY